MDLQEQIYVLAGVFGGVCLILLLFVCYLMFSLSEMHSRMKSHNRHDRSDPRSGNEYAYANPSIVPGEELNRRGYQMHEPQDFAPSGGLAAAGANRFRAQMSTDAGTKDASRDFSSILNNESAVFGGDNGNNFRRSRSIPAPPPPLGKPSNFNDNISFPGQPMNPLGHRQERSGYFNRGGY